MRVSLFITCLGDTMFPQTGRAIVALLERLGAAVEFPEGQTCCGQMHFNTGYADEALPMLRRFVRTFERSEAIVSPSGSCVAMVRENYGRLAARTGDPGLVRAVAELQPRVLELTELIVDRMGLEEVGAFFPHRVTYHPSCHGLRILGLDDKPLRLLRGVRGLDLVELPEATECCGFGGTFSVKNAEVSTAMLSDKVAAILHTSAEICTAADSSCLMHIGGALSRQRTGVRTMHLAEILAATDEASV